jgi:hypothetical protein
MQHRHCSTFVRQRLPGEQTPYEEAWHKLAPHSDSYPNSASFLTAAWPDPYSLLLCESDLATVHELQRWSDEVKRSPKCEKVEVARVDWRDRFRAGLPASADLTVLSFDPYMFDRNGPSRRAAPGNMYPSDLDLLAEAVKTIHAAVLLQLSTYSANNDNPQKEVIAVVGSRLRWSGFEQFAVVPADGNMMSIVFGRNLDRAASMSSLPTRFQSWLRRARIQMGTG